MKSVQHTLALLLTAAFAAGAAHAQNTMPADAASAPQTRDDVKRDRNAATQNGAIPKGDAGVTKARPMGGPAVKRMPEAGESRAAVKSEAAMANRAGEIPKGAAGVSEVHPKGGAVATTTTSSTSRAEVKAETRDAAKAKAIPKGEAGVTADAPKGGEPMKK